MRRSGTLSTFLARPVVPLAVALVLSIAAGFGVTRVTFDASANLLADTSSPAYADQVRFADFFGADPVVVMAEPAKGQQLLTPDRLVGLAQLEGDLGTGRSRTTPAPAPTAAGRSTGGSGTGRPACARRRTG